MLRVGNGHDPASYRLIRRDMVGVALHFFAEVPLLLVPMAQIIPTWTFRRSYLGEKSMCPQRRRRDHGSGEGNLLPPSTPVR